jgi:uncharacterized membrane protein YhfC
MIDSYTMIGMVIQIFVSLLFPIILFIYFRKKQWLSWKSLGVGILIFILFSQILEKTLHFLVIDQSGTSLKWSDSVILFVLYGAFAAGIFEEFGRYFGFRWMLKKRQQLKDGLSFGLGHGGIEAIIIGVLGAINALVLATLINSGTFDATIAPTLPANQADLVKERMLDADFWMYALGGLERIAAIVFHIAMSLLVLLGVRENHFSYVIYAVLIHALLDVAPALYQTGVLTNLLVVEGVIFAFSIGAFFLIVKIKEKFGES